MGAKTGIPWCDATWNPVIGCSKVSVGCDNCYAERTAARFAESKSGDYRGPYFDVMHYNDHGRWVWSGETAFRTPQFNPLKARKPQTILVCSMGDLFHPSVPDEWIDGVLSVIAMTPQHRYMILTKRPERMRAYFDGGKDSYYRAIRIMTTLDMYQDELIDTPEYDYLLEHRQDNASCRISHPDGWPLPNLALGVSVENQYTAEVRVPVLLETPAAKRFVSIEPALGPVDLRYLQPTDPPTEINALEGTHGVLRPHGGKCDKLDLVIIGGESGPNARPMRHDWARLMRDQCQTFGVPFHFKSWGEYCYPSQMPEEIFRAWDCKHGTESTMPKPWRVGIKASGRLLDGVEYDGTINW